MQIELQALQFVHQMEELYFVKRDAQGLLSQMHEQTSWIGTGETEISQNLSEARKALSKEFAEYDGSFTILEQDMHTTLVSSEVCVVYGTIKAVPCDNIIEEQNLRLTVVCLLTPNGMKLAHCNVSRPDTMQLSDHYFVPPSIRASNETLRVNLATKEKQIENLMQNIPGGLHQCLNNDDLTLLSVNDSFLEMFGYAYEDIEAKFDNKYINMIYPDDREELLRTLHEQLSKGHTIELEYRVVCKNGEPLWILDKGNLIADINNGECFYCVLLEISKRKKAQEELRLSLERHKIILNQATDIIFEWDILNDTLGFSANWRKKFGYDPISSTISQNIPLSENIHPDDIPAFVHIMQTTAAGTPYSETEFRIRDITGVYIWSRIRATAQFNEKGKAIKAVGVISDISTEKEERLALQEQAQKDALTGLFNKSAIKFKVEQFLDNPNHISNQAMLIIDIDYFKSVNDTYGHLCGDALLSDVANVLKNHFRISDLIGRIGGDEFLVYLPNASNVQIVMDKAHSLLAALSAIRPAPNAPAITCSIGVAVLPCNDTNYFNLYHCADRALYQQKNNGRNGVSFYDSTTYESSILCELTSSAVNEAIESETSDIIEEKLAQYTFQILYQSTDINQAVNRLLEIVGHAYGVSRVYIFESSEDGLSCNNTFEWCSQNIRSEIGNLQNIRYKEDLDDYLRNFNDDGIFYCHDITSLTENLYNILAAQGIRSLLQCAILDKGQFKGYIGFDECRENCLWSKEQIRSLSLIANVLSVFLIRLRLEEKINKM